MSDVESSRYNAPKGPKSRTLSSSTRSVNCWYDPACYKEGCYFDHPKRDALRGSGSHEYSVNTAHGKYESYRPAPLKPLNTNTSHATGPNATPSIPTEFRGSSRPAQDDEARDGRRGSSAARSSTFASRGTDRLSTPRGDNTVNASREVAKNDVAATASTGDRMEVDLPVVGQQAQQEELKEKVEIISPAPEPVVMATEGVQQSSDTKQTKTSEDVREIETHPSPQRQLSSDVLLVTDPRLRHLESREDSDFDAMSFADVLSWVIKVRIHINEVETRRRHIRNNLLSYEKTIEKDQHEGRGSIWQETYDAEKARLQQIENELQDLSKRLKAGFGKIATLTLNTSENTAGTTIQGQENEALRKENESLREKLEDHSKAIQALQAQLQEMRSSQLMTKDDGVKTTEPLIFRLNRLEGTITKTVNSRLQEEADYNKAALDQHDTNIGVQQDLRILKNGFSDVSGQLSTVASQQTETSALFQSINAKLPNSLKEFADFTADVPKRIEHLESLVLKGKFAAIDADTFGGDIAEKAVGTSGIGERTSALEVQLFSLRQRLDGFTMDQHLRNIINAIQQIWHPESGAFVQRLDKIELTSRNTVRSHGEWAKTMEAAIKTKAEGADLTQLREILNETLSSSTTSQNLVKELSNALADNQVRYKGTRQELDAIKTSVAIVKTLQDENKAKFEKFVSEFEIALGQQTQGDGIRDEIINSSSNNLNNLIVRVEQLEQGAESRSDTKSRNGDQPRPESVSLDSDDTSQGPASPKVAESRSDGKSRPNGKSRNDVRPRRDTLSLDSDDTSRGSASSKVTGVPPRLGSWNPVNKLNTLKRSRPDDNERKRGNKRPS